MLNDFKAFIARGNVLDLAIGVIIGAAFGARSYSKERTELIVFMTARVIYDTNEISEASEELKSRLKKLTRYIKE